MQMILICIYLRRGYTRARRYTDGPPNMILGLVESTDGAFDRFVTQMSYYCHVIVIQLIQNPLTFDC